MGLLFKSHPWHGISIGDQFPQTLTAYIEMVPTDTVKYEIDKTTGFLKVDRPQLFSSTCPVLYGLVPQTLCAEQIAEFCMQQTGREGVVGDMDPLDICVLTERHIPHGDIMLETHVIGGFRMIDGDEADDKIIGVLKKDPLYGSMQDVSDCPPLIIDRLRHYFLTYKEIPGESHKSRCEITHIYGHEEAWEVVRRSHEDYERRFNDIEGMLTALLKAQIT